MIKTKQYNNIPESMLPKLERDEVAIFVSMHNSKGPDGHGLFPTYGVNNIATIMTPEGPTEIAFVTAAAPEGHRPQLGDVIFETSQKGAIVCKGSSPTDVRKFQFLTLHPENEANGGTMFKREVPGEKSKKALERQKLDFQAMEFAMNTSLDVLKSLLKERGIEAKGRSEEDVRLLATEEGKKKPFEQPKVSILGEFEAKWLKEQYDAQVIRWNVQNKSLVNEITDVVYQTNEVRQTDKDKISKLLLAATRDAELATTIKDDIEATIELTEAVLKNKK